MTWRDNLRPALIGGVPVHVDSRAESSGRRIALHEYPKRDTPFPEDMGKDTRKWSLDVYLIGDDYMSRRDRLMRKCEANGAFSYTDFWGRSHRVVCDKIQLKETQKDGRYCSFSVSLIEAGAGAGPFSSIATTVALVGAATSLASSAVAGLAASGALPAGTAAVAAAVKRFSEGE